MPFHLGGAELVILLVIVVVLVGAGRIGKIGGELGRGIREFRQEVSGDSESAPSDTKK